MRRIIAIIPARMGSSRFPGKPLAKLCGRPMLEHVFRRTSACKLLDEVIIATCDEEISHAAKGFGAKTVMTSASHDRATDRVAELPKSTSILINTARRGLIDERALITALREGWIAGAALDVCEIEPLPMDSPLRNLQSVYLAPHNANASLLAADNVHTSSIRDLLQALDKWSIR